ncbi:MAG TPA: HAD family hydrolase [Gaiellaceae bacterium]|nr:HAD family hydrolase [Gaiellaceae bacterium]
MLRAVLFDWGDTLIEFAYAPELVAAGHHAGLAAIGRERMPELTEHFREEYEPLFWAPGIIEEIEYPQLVRRLLGDFGIAVDDGELDRFLEAEHEAWEPARRLGAHTHPLLEALRERGLGVGLVSNAFDPGWLLHRDLERMGIEERLDVSVFSSEVGVRKPHPAIFERALEALEVAPEDALFVGDRLFEDVRGAAELGMTTVQALWYRADSHPDGAEPDHQAFTQLDVLNIARRLAT